MAKKKKGEKPLRVVLLPSDGPPRAETVALTVETLWRLTGDTQEFGVKLIKLLGVAVLLYYPRFSDPDDIPLHRNETATRLSGSPIYGPCVLVASSASGASARNTPDKIVRHLTEGPQEEAMKDNYVYVATRKDDAKEQLQVDLGVVGQAPPPGFVAQS